MTHVQHEHPRATTESRAMNTADILPPLPSASAAVPITDEMLIRLADRLWEEGHISSLSRNTSVIFARAVLALATRPQGEKE